MAYTTGTGLILLVFVAVPLQVWANTTWPAAIVGTAHGFLYIGYLITALDLGIRMRWHIVRLALVMLAGTVPFLSFVAEHNVTQLARAQAAGQTAAGE